MTTLVLIHGAFSHGAHFDAWKKHLAAAGHDCHTPDLPGHGVAAGDLGRETLATYRALMRELIDKLASPPVLIGHSMGGLIAQQLASEGLCRALVCVASAPPWMLQAQPRALSSLLPMMPRLLAGKALPPPSEATLRKHILHDLPADEAEQLLPTFGGESGRAFREMIVGTARLSGKPFRGPVLCISAEDDHIISQRISNGIARLYEAEHRRFGYGHFLLAPSRAAEMTALIDGWLKALPAQ